MIHLNIKARVPAHLKQLKWALKEKNYNKMDKEDDLHLAKSQKNCYNSYLPLHKFK